MSPQPDTVSVIIPCYRQAGFLPEAIESVLAQTHPHQEIVVVDDGSPDDTAGVAGRYARLGNVRYVRQSNQGLAAARNTGIAMSSSDYLVFLDADDWLLSNHFATALDAFKAHPEAAFVCGDFRMVGPDTTWQHKHCCDPEPDHYARLIRVNFIAALQTVTFRRQAVVEAGGFRTELKACEDYDLLLRIARRHPIYCHHTLIAEYRRYAPQMSQNWDLMLRFMMKVLREQRLWVRGKPAYEEACREAIARCRDHFGERTLWHMVATARSGRYRKAARQCLTLARFYPQGLASLIAGKMARTLRWHPRQSV
jgi:glycosyltransferase involved in cell wall biosynthesis